MKVENGILKGLSQLAIPLSDPSIKYKVTFTDKDGHSVFAQNVYASQDSLSYSMGQVNGYYIGSMGKKQSDVNGILTIEVDE